MMSEFKVTHDNLDEALGVLREVLDEGKRSKQLRLKSLLCNIEDLEQRIETMEARK